MKNFLTTLSLILFATLYVQSQTLSNSYLGCSSFNVSFSGTVFSNLYTSPTTFNCFNAGVRRVAGPSVYGANFQLQQRDGSGNFVNSGSPIETNAASVTYSNLEPGIYRVLMGRRNSTGTSVYPAYFPCNSASGIWHNGGSTVFISPNIEIGTPTVSGIIYPAPTGVPAKICYSRIDAPNEVLQVDGSNSFGERGYQVAVFKDNLATGQNEGYASSSWITGTFGVFNLKSLNMVYEPGYKYTVQLALTQLPCTGWVDLVQSFIVDGSCRERDDMEIKAYPNPTSDVLNFDGLESWGAKEISVNVTDILGKEVMNTTVQSPYYAISLSDLPSGNYQVTLRNEENMVSKKVVRQ